MRTARQWSVRELQARGLVSPNQAAPLLAANASNKLLDRASRRDLEAEEQVLVVDWFRSTYPEHQKLLIANANGGSRANRFEGWRLKQQGVLAGVHDLQLCMARGGYNGLWLELKATPPNDARVSASQRDWATLMQEQGYCARICRGMEAAMDLLIAYMAMPCPSVRVDLGQGLPVSLL